MSGIEGWSVRLFDSPPHSGKTSGADHMLAAARALMLDGRKHDVVLIDHDPKNPWRGQALTLAEYAAHGGRCPAPSICACQPIAR